MVTYGPQAIRESEDALLVVDRQGIRVPLQMPGGEVAALEVTDENAASFDFGEPLTTQGRPTGIVRWAYLGLLGLACLVPVGAVLAFLTLRLTRRGAG
jgi:hypothetical protein